MKNQKGITLIALVITIIVLLILAGVSIAMLTGQNGILTQAQNANDATLKGEAEEAVKLAINTIMTNKSAEEAGVNSNTTITKLTTLTAGNIKQVMENNNATCIVGYYTGTTEDSSAEGAGNSVTLTYKNNANSQTTVNVTVTNGAVKSVTIPED